MKQGQSETYGTHRRDLKEECNPYHKMNEIIITPLNCNRIAFQIKIRIPQMYY